MVSTCSLSTIIITVCVRGLWLTINSTDRSALHSGSFFYTLVMITQLLFMLFIDQPLSTGDLIHHTFGHRPMLELGRPGFFHRPVPQFTMER